MQQASHHAGLLLPIITASLLHIHEHNSRIVHKHVTSQHRELGTSQPPAASCLLPAYLTLCSSLCCSLPCLHLCSQRAPGGAEPSAEEHAVAQPQVQRASAAASIILCSSRHIGPRLEQQQRYQQCHRVGRP
jgi:hypothetical protein